jgi:tRNA (cytidine/uridine-2'-O-)-methyltransferase
MRLALFQPDIPQNLGGAIRTAVCFGTALDIIEPCGFPLTDKAIRRAAMDYEGLARIRRHAGWDHFVADLRARGDRLVLLSTAGATSIWDVAFKENDVLLMGRESAGVPDAVRAEADIRARIPLAKGARSLNVVVAAGVALAEARRQIGLN